MRAHQLELLQARQEALDARRAALLEEEKLLAAEERLVGAELRQWRIQEERLHLMHTFAQEEDDGDGSTARRRRKRNAVSELLAARRAGAAASGRALGTAAERRVVSERAREAERQAEEAHWDLRALIRQHYNYMVPVPVNVLLDTENSECNRLFPLDVGMDDEALSLPVEMLRKIFRSLHTSDLVTAGQVCSRWRGVVKHPAVWLGVGYIERADEAPSADFPKCRLLSAAPYLDEAVFLSDKHKNCFGDGLKVRKIDILNCPEVSSFLRSWNQMYSSLELQVRNHEVAEAMDSQCVGLKQLVLHYQSDSPFAFKSQFVKKSTLVDLKCKTIPIDTLKSILRGHNKTLESLTLMAPRFCEESLTLHGFSGCDRLYRVEVPCCYSFCLPPSCTSVSLTVLSSCKAGGCRASGCLAFFPSNVTHLHLQYEDSSSSSRRTVRMLKRHLRDLSLTFLAALQVVSISVPQPLSVEQVAKLVTVAGRGLKIVSGQS